MGSHGPLSNVDLWKELLTELDLHVGEVNWGKIPSHVGIQGDEEADSLAENGRLLSPLLANSLAPSARHLRHSVPPQRETELPKTTAPPPILVSNSDSNAPSDPSLDGVDAPASPAAPDSKDLYTFARDHVPITLATPVSHPAVARPLLGTPGFYPLEDSPATQLVMSLDLQLLHAPCDNLLHGCFGSQETQTKRRRFLHT